MITQVKIEDFRSIESATVTLGPLTVLYGPTSSGKSTLFYALLAARNFIVDPNRQADAFLNLLFMDLGGFEACVFNHEAARSISVSVTDEDDNNSATYTLEMSRKTAKMTLASEKDPQLMLDVTVDLPFGGAETVSAAFVENGTAYSIGWNGIAATVTPGEATAETQDRARRIATELNWVPRQIKAIDIAPSRRGFFKPNYSPAAVSILPTTEDEVASIIINDQYMAARISQYTEQIFNRDFRTYQPHGTSTVFFQSTDKLARMPALLVNDGFGVNQVVYLFAKLYRPEVNCLLIEEPEAHLHPTALRNLARALCEFVQQEQTQIILTTHSEQFLSSMLTMVGDKCYPAKDLVCYLVGKDGRNTKFTRQEVTEDGQVAGGLTSFIEGELQDIHRMFAARKAASE